MPRLTQHEVQTEIARFEDDGNPNHELAPQAAGAGTRREVTAYFVIGYIGDRDAHSARPRRTTVLRMADVTEWSD